MSCSATLLFHGLVSFPIIISSKALFYKMFAQKSCFCGSRGISLSTDRNTGGGKAAYIWISPDPAKVGPTLGGGGGGGVDSNLIMQNCE